MLTAINVCIDVGNREENENETSEEYELYNNIEAGNEVVHACLQDTHDQRAHYKFSADICTKSNLELYNFAIEPLINNLLLFLFKSSRDKWLTEELNNCLSAHERERASQLTVIVDGSSVARQKTLTSSHDGIILLTLKHLLALCCTNRHVCRNRRESEEEYTSHKECNDEINCFDDVTKEKEYKYEQVMRNNDWDDSRCREYNAVDLSQVGKDNPELCEIEGIYLSIYSLDTSTNQFTDTLDKTLGTAATRKDVKVTESANSKEAIMEHIADSNTISSINRNSNSGKKYNESIVPITVVEDRHEHFTSIEGGTCEFINNEAMLPKVAEIVESSFISSRNQVFSLIITLSQQEVSDVNITESKPTILKNSLISDHNALEKLCQENSNNVYSSNAVKRCSANNTETKWKEEFSNVVIQFVSLASTEYTSSKHPLIANDSLAQRANQKEEEHYTAFMEEEQRFKKSNTDAYGEEESASAAIADDLQAIRFSLTSAAMLLTCSGHKNTINFESDNPLLFLLKPALLMEQPAVFISCFAPYKQGCKNIANNTCNSSFNDNHSQVRRYHDAIQENVNNEKIQSRQKSRQVSHKQSINRLETFITAFNVAQMAQRIYNIRHAPWCNLINNVKPQLHLSRTVESLPCATDYEPIQSKLDNYESQEDTQATIRNGDVHHACTINAYSHGEHSCNANKNRRCRRSNNARVNPFANNTHYQKNETATETGVNDWLGYNMEEHERQEESEEELEFCEPKPFVSKHVFVNKSVSNAGLVHTPAYNIARQVENYYNPSQTRKESNVRANIKTPFVCENIHACDKENESRKANNAHKYNEEHCKNYDNSERATTHNHPYYEPAMKEMSEVRKFSEGCKHEEDDVRKIVKTCNVHDSLMECDRNDSKEKLRCREEKKVTHNKYNRNNNIDHNARETNTNNQVINNEEDLSKEDELELVHNSQIERVHNNLKLPNLLNIIKYQNKEIDEHLRSEHELWRRCTETENALKRSEEERARLRSELIELQHRYVYKERHLPECKRSLSCFK